MVQPHHANHVELWCTDDDRPCRDAGTLYGTVQLDVDFDLGLAYGTNGPCFFGDWVTDPRPPLDFDATAAYDLDYRISEGSPVCGLDADDGARCFVSPFPAQPLVGVYTSVSADLAIDVLSDDQTLWGIVCGVRQDAEIGCWSNSPRALPDFSAYTSDREFVAVKARISKDGKALNVCALDTSSTWVCPKLHQYGDVAVDVLIEEEDDSGAFVLTDEWGCYPMGLPGSVVGTDVTCPGWASLLGERVDLSYSYHASGGCFTTETDGLACVGSENRYMDPSEWIRP